MKSLLVLFLFVMLLIPLANASTTYNYRTQDIFIAKNILFPITYVNSINYQTELLSYNITSYSTKSSSYSIFINIFQNITLNETTMDSPDGYNINVSSLELVYPGNKLYITPLVIYISSVDSSSLTLPFSSLSLVFDNENNNMVQLINNGKVENKTFCIPFTNSFSSINVKWGMLSNLSSGTYSANIKFMVVLSNSMGVDYVYFWNIFIDIHVSSYGSVINNSITPAQNVYAEDCALNVQQITNILNLINS